MQAQSGFEVQSGLLAVRCDGGYVKLYPPIPMQRKPTATRDKFLKAQFHTRVTYNLRMKATFIELPPFERIRKVYMDDEAYRLFQLELMDNPTAGDVIEGTGGLRKLRQADPRRGKGKRGGLRVIYYFWSGCNQFWLFTVYDKDQAVDLTTAQRKVLKQLLKNELKNRQTPGGEHDDQ